MNKAIVKQVEHSAENIRRSSDNIHGALHNFEESTREIAEYNEGIAAIRELSDKFGDLINQGSF